MAYVPGKRRSIPPGKYLDNMASEAMLLASDPDADSLVRERDPGEEDDFDWVVNVPGRPSPYSVTWNLVYGGRKPVKTGGFEVACGEGNDGVIKMNSLLQEVNASSTPHGALRKPPVCHIIPWVLLSVALDEHQHTVGKTLREDFRRYVCWGDTTNLRTGHNGCNAGGVKVTAQTATSSEKSQATAFVLRCLSQYSGHPYAT